MAGATAMFRGRSSGWALHAITSSHHDQTARGILMLGATMSPGGASVEHVSDPTEPNAAETINAMHTGTWAGTMGLELLRATRDEVVGELVVQPSHRQPHGIVHGGVYSSVIESLASIGAALDAMRHGRTVVGLENHTSFVRAVREGVLRATARPLTRGRRSQAWEVTIVDSAGAIVATGRVRLLVLEPEATVAGAEIGSKPA
jgi:1,4-dihydroxy-2-naphthoyl-CoA hydrolase